MANSSKHVLIRHLAYVVIRTTASASIIHLIGIGLMHPLSILCLIPHFLLLIPNGLGIAKWKLVSLHRWMLSLRLHLLHSFVLWYSWASLTYQYILRASLWTSLLVLGVLPLNHVLTSILIPLLHLQSMLLLLIGQYLLYFVHFILCTGVLHQIFVLSHHVLRPVVLRHVHLCTAAVVPQTAVRLDRFDVLSLLFWLFLHFILIFIKQIQNMILNISLTSSLYIHIQKI